MKKILLVLSLIVLSTFSARAATYDPSIHWREQASEHFVFVYSDTLPLDTLQNIQKIAEEEYAAITSFLGSTVKSKIYFVISDSYDLFNASATLVPRNRVELYLQPATNGDSNSLWDIRSSDSLRMTIHHELVHIIQMNVRGGVFKFLHAIFGVAASPNMFFPRSYIEGLAVYSETTTHQGRGFGTLYDMVLRTDVLNQDLRKLDEVKLMSRQWQQGTRVYLYGYKFLDYLARTYGEAKLTRLIHAVGRRFPLFVTGAFDKTYGRPLGDLWLDWQKTLPETYEAQRRDLLREGESIAETVFVSGGSVASLLLSPDQNTLYFVWAGIDHPKSLVAFDLKTRQKRILSKGSFVGKIAMSPDGKSLYYTKLDVYDQVKLNGDLYVYNLENGSEKRLTRGERVTDVAAFPDGLGLFYITVDQGQFSLWRRDLATGQKIELNKPLEVRVWHEPVFAPDGSLSILGQDNWGRDRIYTCDFGDSKWRVLEPEAYWISGLSVGFNGELYFTTDRVGAPNVDSYSPKTGLQVRRTAVVSGAFFGVPATQDLYYSEFSSRGFIIKKTRLDSHFGRPQRLKAVSLMPSSAKVSASDSGANNTTPLSDRRYQPMRQLLKPYSLTPILANDDEGFRAGVSLNGGDVLNHHAYSLGVSYGFLSERLGYGLTYTYNRLYPQFTLQVFDEANRFEDYFENPLTGELQDYWQRERGVFVDMTLPIVQRLKSGLSVGVSYFFDDVESLTSELPYDANEASITGHAVWYFLDGTPYALWPRIGFVLEGLGERIDERLGSDYNQTRWVGSLKLYAPPPFKRHAFSVLAKGGLASGDLTDAFFLGGTAGLNEFRPNNDFYPLRGYPARLFSGNRFAFGQVEYGLPLFYVDRGFTNFPLHLDSMALKGFYEIGSAWTAGDIPNFKDSAGLEWQSGFRFLDALLFWNLGVAQGLRDDGETRFYMNLSAGF